MPTSAFNLLGWSSYHKQLQQSQPKTLPRLTFGGADVALPLSSGTATGSQRGGLFSFRCRPVHTKPRALVSAAKEETERQVEQDGVAPAEEDKLESHGSASAAEEEEKRQMAEQGGVVLAKARELMLLQHHRLGEVVKVGAIQNMIRKGDLRVTNAQVRDAMLAMKPTELECDACDLAATNRKHPSAEKSGIMPGQWTMDLSGKYWRSRRGNHYATVVVAPGGKGLFTAFTKKKSSVVDVLRHNRRRWQRITGEKMARLRMDRAGEHTGHKMTQFLDHHGIIPSFTAPNSSAGPAEGYIHILQDAMSAMLNHYATMHGCERPLHLWDYAFRYASDVKAMTWTSTNDGVSMYEKQTGRAPPLDKCHVFGAPVFANIPKAQRGKGANRGRSGRFMGFAEDGPGFIILDHETNKIFRSDSVRVHDNKAATQQRVEDAGVTDAVNREIEFSPREPLDGGKEEPAPDLQPDRPLTAVAPEVKPQEPQPEEEHDEQQPEEEHDGFIFRRKQVQQSAMLSRANGESVRDFMVREDAAEKKKEEQMIARLAARAKTMGSFLRARTGALPTGLIPQSADEALSGDDKEMWRAAIDEEDGGLEKRGVMIAVPLSAAAGRKPVGSKYVFDIKLRSPTCTLTGPCYKTLPDGRKVRYKARMVAKGFSQKQGIDFKMDEKYAPTPQIASIRMILPHVFSKGWEVRQLDAKQAFLIPPLPDDEQIIMAPPPGSKFDGKYLVRLLRSLYGLVQAAHHWHREIKGTLLKHEFTCIDADQGVYVRYDKEGDLLCALALHVDDCLVSAPDGTLEQVTTKLKDTYEMTDQAADWFLKINIVKSADQHKMCLSQPEYAKEILRTAGFDPTTSNSVSTPMETPLCKGDLMPFTEEEAEFMGTRYEAYGTLVGMTSHLANGTRPDLSYSVGQVRLYTKFPRRHHWTALMRIMRYIKGTINHGLVFRADGEKRIIGWCDSDHAGNLSDRTSTSGFVFTYLGTAFSWASKKQAGKKQGRPREGEEQEENKRVTSDTSRSTAEAELRALDLADREALWLRKLGSALRVPSSETIPVHEDNEACYYIAKGSRWSSQTKHVATMYYAVRDDIIDGRIDLIPVASTDNIADIFTKPLKRVLFEKFRMAMGVHDVPQSMI